MRRQKEGIEGKDRKERQVGGDRKEKTGRMG